MDFLTIDMVKMHCRIEDYSKDPERQREIDNKIKTEANKAEQEVYAHIGRNYFDIIREWGEVPPAIKLVALSLVAKRVIETPFDDGISVKMLLQPYKKQINNK